LTARFNFNLSNSIATPWQRLTALGKQVKSAVKQTFLNRCCLNPHHGLGIQHISTPNTHNMCHIHSH